MIVLGKTGDILCGRKKYDILLVEANPQLMLDGLISKENGIPTNNTWPVRKDEGLLV